MPSNRAAIISKLQQDILQLQGFKPASVGMDMGLGAIESAFPNETFPRGAVHEFLANGKEDIAASTGFIAALLSILMKCEGTSLWISASRTLFPPALKNFGIQPDRFIFIDLKKEKEVMWAMEEALKCGALSAVVSEIPDVTFTASRRLQLAVEQSHVTGFILRNHPHQLNNTACVSRWRVTPLTSESIDDLPGIGFPKWKVELLRIRNGRPGVWEVKYENGRMVSIQHAPEKESISYHPEITKVSNSTVHASVDAAIEHKKTG